MSDNDLRDRWKAVGRYSRQKKDDALSFWDDQKRMQAEDKRLETELEQAKRKAKELKRTLRKHKLGESRELSKEYLQKSRTYSSQAISKGRGVVRRYPKQLAAGAVVILVVAVGVNILSRNDSQTGTLGDATGIIIQDDLPREKPVFKLLIPNGASQESYDVVRISPDEADPSYTYLDRFIEGGAIFRVTQQAIPENFDLPKIAREFQATSIIQVDDVTVYHGYSEQGGIQSLLFEKADKLISIRSPQKFSDDQWAAYVTSLK